jgi:carboxyl-terminal processing protease
MRKATIPLLLSISMALGVALGVGLSNKRQSSSRPEWQKIDEILRYVKEDYVDTISQKTLEEEVIAYLLQRLDPHSYYITQENVAEMNEPLDGGFQGIGIQFNVKSDTIYVIKVIANGPSEKAGIQAGDQIISADTTLLAGGHLSTNEIMAYLKGESGTSVAVGILRNGQKLSIEIERAEIPLSSIDAAYLLNDTTIYLKLARFSKNTFDEFQSRVYPLKSTKTTDFILDLRGNGGGYLEASTRIADEFLKSGLLITYTEGKSRPRADVFATDEGAFEGVRLSLIIDGYSASASEILAGAMQDHGRATIFGKRSFGKGLVQEQSEWADGSATRLTVARYYTPNGRSIQRPYKSFDDERNYFGSPLDTSHQGGIVPDVETKRDTSGITWLYAELVHGGLINDFVYDFRDSRLKELVLLSFPEFEKQFTDEFMLGELRKFLDQRGFQINDSEWARSGSKMAERCRAILARILFDDEAYFKIVNPSDETIRAILSSIKKPKPAASAL